MTTISFFENFSSNSHEILKAEESSKKDKKEKKVKEDPKPQVSVDPSFSGGRLVLDVVAGRDLASKDSNGLSDPFCEIYLLDDGGNPIKKSKNKTKIIKKCK